MRHLILTALAFSIVACGKAGSSGGTGTASSTNNNNPPPPQLQLSSAQANALADLAMQNLVDLVANLTGLADAYFQPGSNNITLTVPCPQGGTATMTGSGNVNVALSGISLVNGTGTATFANCMIPAGAASSATLNGTLSTSLPTDTVTVTAVNASLSNWTANGSGVTTGTLQVTIGGVTKPCTFNVNGTMNGTGTLNPQTYAVAGSFAGTVTGTICGNSVTRSQTFDF